MKSVAVIMSIYHSDNPDMLKIAIDSILNQSVRCDLLIYQDGAIPIDLASALDDYVIFDNVFVFRNDKNRGLAVALNYLIEFAITRDYEYIARMDSDDISRCDRIEKQILYMQSNPSVGVLGTSCREFGSSYAIAEKHLPRMHADLLKFSITRCPLIHPSVMFRVSILKEGYRYPENTSYTEDMALWFIMLAGGVRFANINDVLLDYRLNEGTIYRRRGISKALSETFIRTKYMFILKHFNFYNVTMITARFFFHLMPSCIVKLSYKKLR